MNLFIIGNGFDIAHEIDSKYSDFKEYLEKNYSGIADSDMPDPITKIIDGKVECDIENAANIIWHLFSETECCIKDIDIFDNSQIDWSNLEELLGKIEYINCFNTCSDFPNKKEVLENQICAFQIAEIVKKLPYFLEKWVETINEKAEVKEKFNKLINKDKDIFITFNYTRILENTYKCKRVYHFHGEKGKDKLILGHCNKEFETDIYDEYLVGVSYILKNIHEELKKNVDEIINSYSDLWDKLNNIEKIYSYGFSYGNVDLPYIKKIIESCPMCNEWYIEDFPKEDQINIFKSKIKECGFKGKIDSFNIK